MVLGMNSLKLGGLHRTIYMTFFFIYSKENYAKHLQHKSPVFLHLMAVAKADGGKQGFFSPHISLLLKLLREILTPNLCTSCLFSVSARLSNTFLTRSCILVTV